MPDEGPDDDGAAQYGARAGFLAQREPDPERAQHRLQQQDQAHLGRGQERGPSAISQVDSGVLLKKNKN